jgi:hypothetical protein
LSQQDAKNSHHGTKGCHTREGGYPSYLKTVDSRLHGNDDFYNAPPIMDPYSGIFMNR